MSTRLRDMPTGRLMLLGFCAICLSPLVALAIVVAVSPWGLGTLGVVLVIYLVIAFARRRSGQLEEEPHVDIDTPSQQQ